MITIVLFGLATALVVSHKNSRRNHNYWTNTQHGCKVSGEPECQKLSNFLAKIVHELLETPASLRLVQVPGTSERIDKANVTNISIKVTR